MIAELSWWLPHGSEAIALGGIGAAILLLLRRKPNKK